MLVFLIVVLIIGLIIFFIKKVNATVSVGLKPVKEYDNINPKVLVIDIETTGLIADNSLRVTKSNLENYSSNFPRIVQLSYILMDNLGNYEGATMFVKQTERIPESAIRIHGITNEKCEKEGSTLKEVIDDLSVAARKVDSIVGHNIGFDYKVIHAECVRNKIPFPLVKKNKVDTMRLTVNHLGLKKHYKISLYNAVERLLKNSKQWPQIKAKLRPHDAESDALATALIYLIVKGK
jgi:DNA polymerase-3 subunit epsilon